jgi:hypothetical protein
MARRFQFSLRIALLLVFVLALIAWPTSDWLRAYLANKGLVPVNGSIWHSGKGLANATITFIPLQPGAKSVRGATKTSGSFQTETLVTPGDYIVVVAENSAATAPRVPPKYANATTSPLRVTISATGDNHFHFDVTN